MKILKYKKSTKGRYKVLLDDGRELLLYEEVILKYDLLLKKEIDEELMIEVDKCNQSWDVYYVALRSIENRYKSVYELRLWLLKREYPLEYVDSAIEKLEKQGYLNDLNYTKSFINNQIVTTNKGPYRIMRELQEKKIKDEYINSEIVCFDEELQRERIKKLIEKGIRSNHTKGGVVLKQKIYNSIKDLGYEISLINSVISNYSFGNDSDIAKKEYSKLYRKYSRKYEGNELKRILKEKMYAKGLQYEEDFNE